MTFKLITMQHSLLWILSHPADQGEKGQYLLSSNVVIATHLDYFKREPIHGQCSCQRMLVLRTL